MEINATEPCICRYALNENSICVHCVSKTSAGYLRLSSVEVGRVWLNQIVRQHSKYSALHICAFVSACVPVQMCAIHLISSLYKNKHEA